MTTLSILNVVIYKYSIHEKIISVCNTPFFISGVKNFVIYSQSNGKTFILQIDPKFEESGLTPSLTKGQSLNLNFALTFWGQAEKKFEKHRKSNKFSVETRNFFIFGGYTKGVKAGI